MAKSLLRLEARKLRQRGVSIRRIATHLSISKSTVSLWVRDIVLSVEQLEDLKKSEIKGRDRGRLRNAFLQKEKRLKLISDFADEGEKLLKNLTDRELLVAGLSLYWGEGGKTNRRVEFCNSDPKMIQFLTHWLSKCFGVSTNDLRCYVGINEIHHKREQIVKDYWSKITNIPSAQFRKTSFKKVENKKIYENFHTHYGTLSVKVAKSSQLHYRILGLIKGLYISLPG